MAVLAKIQNRAIQSTMTVLQALKKMDEVKVNMGVKLLPLDNAIRPGTVNSSAELLLADDRIYFLAAAHDHPIKTVFEGDSIQIEADAMHTTDKCYAITITYRVGVAAVLGNKFGVLSLN